jgi:hypothetical protein
MTWSAPTLVRFSAGILLSSFGFWRSFELSGASQRSVTETLFCLLAGFFVLTYRHLMEWTPSERQSLRSTGRKRVTAAFKLLPWIGLLQFFIALLLTGIAKAYVSQTAMAEVFQNLGTVLLVVLVFLAARFAVLLNFNGE